MNNTDLDKEFKAHIHPRVFWDCRFEELDIEKDKIFIIGRVLMRGTDKEIPPTGASLQLVPNSKFIIQNS